MPLIPGNLIDEVLKLTDKTDADFVGFPVGTEEEINTQASENWAAAASSFLATLTQPPGAGVAAAAAESAAAAAMKAALEAGSPGLEELIDAFGKAIELAGAAFATTQGTLSLTPLPPIDDPVPPATTFESDVTTWVAGGLFTPPGGSPTPWS